MSLAHRILILATVVALTLPASVRAGHDGVQLDVKDPVEGTGAEAVINAKVKVHYTGWLKDGTKFDSSLDRGEPFEFTLGAGEVIQGWDVGVEGMKVGGKRVLIIPPQLGYGKRGAGSSIPPNATLKFEIELLGVTPPKYANIENDELAALVAKGVKVIDIRRQDEWDKTGLIAGAHKLTAFDGRGQFNQNFVGSFKDLVKKDEEVVIICQHGNRSAVIANFLTERLNYPNVRNARHGMAGWIKESRPVVK